MVIEDDPPLSKVTKNVFQKIPQPDLVDVPVPVRKIKNNEKPCIPPSNKPIKKSSTTKVVSVKK